MFKKKKKQKSEPQPQLAEKKPVEKPVAVGPKLIPKVEPPKSYWFIITLMSGVNYEIQHKFSAGFNEKNEIAVDTELENTALGICLRGFRFEDKWFSLNVIKQVRWEER